MSLENSYAGDLFQEAIKLTELRCYKEAKEKYTAYIEKLLSDSAKEKLSEQERNKSLAVAYNNRGHIYYKEVDFDQAKEDYTQALMYNDKMAVAFYNRGTIHYRLGDYEEAVVDMEQATKLDKQNAEYRIGLWESKKAAWPGL